MSNIHKNRKGHWIVICTKDHTTSLVLVTTQIPGRVKVSQHVNMREAYENAVKPLGEILSRGDNPLMNIQMYPCQGYTPWLLGKRFWCHPGVSIWHRNILLKVVYEVISNYYNEILPWKCCVPIPERFFFSGTIFLEGGGGEGGFDSPTLVLVPALRFGF